MCENFALAGWQDRRMAARQKTKTNYNKEDKAKTTNTTKKTQNKVRTDTTIVHITRTFNGSKSLLDILFEIAKEKMNIDQKTTNNA